MTTFALTTRAAKGSPLTHAEGDANFNAMVRKADTVADLLALASAPTDGCAFATLGYWSAGDGGSSPYRWDAASTATHDGALVLKITAVTVGRFIFNGNDSITPEQAGAKGDDVADDYLILQRCIDYLVVGGGTLNLGKGRIYNIYSNSLILSGAVNINPNGATIHKSVNGASNSAILADPQSFGTSYACNVGSGNYTKTITTTVAANAGTFVDGDYVYVSWGINPFDITLPYANSINVVRSAVAGTGVITLEFAIPYDWTYTQTPQIRKLNYPWSGTIYSGLTIKMADLTTAGIYANYSFFGKIKDLTAVNCASIAVISAICNGLSVDGLVVKRITEDAFARGVPVNVWASTYCTFNRVQQFNTKGGNSTFLIESQSRFITVSNSHLTMQNGGAVPAGIYVDNSDVLIINNTFENYLVSWTTRNGGTVKPINNVVKTASANPVSGSVIDFYGNYLESLAGVSRAVKGMQSFKFTITAVPGTGTNNMIPAGISAALSSGLFCGISCKLSTPVTSGLLRIRPYIGAQDQVLVTVTNSYQRMASMSDDNANKFSFSAGDQVLVEVLSDAVLPAATINIDCEVLLGYGT